MAHSAESFQLLQGVLQGLLQQVLGGNEDVVVTAGRKGPITDNAFFQLEVHVWPPTTQQNPISLLLLSPKPRRIRICGVTCMGTCCECKQAQGLSV